MIFSGFTLEFRAPFLSEKRSEPYIMYGEVSIAGENGDLNQDSCGAGSSAAWQARGCGDTDEA